MIADVDCTEERDLCQKHGVQGYPTLKSFKKGKEFAEFYDRQKDAILRYAATNAGGGDVEDEQDDGAFNGKSEAEPEDYPADAVHKIVGSSFAAKVLDESKHVFIKIYAPWCGHCKNMAPAWEELAKEYADNDDVIIAEIDATANDLPTNYQVRGYPTIFWAGKDNKDAPEKYKGQRNVASWKQFIDAYVGVHQKQKDEL